MKQTQSIGLSSLVDSIYSSRNAFGAFKINLFWFLFQYSSNSFSMQSIYCFVLKTRRLKLQHLYFLYFSATKVRINIHFSKFATYIFVYLTYINFHKFQLPKQFCHFFLLTPISIFSLYSLYESRLTYRQEKAISDDGYCLSFMISRKNYLSLRG